MRFVLAGDEGRLAFEREQEQGPLVVTSTVAVGDGRWHRVSLLYQNQKLRLGVDGEESSLEGTVKSFRLSPDELPQFGKFMKSVQIAVVTPVAVGQTSLGGTTALTLVVSAC